MKLLFWGGLVALWFVVGCTLSHRIEPSDKPLIVNLNVKIDHKIEIRIRDENQDLLNLEEEYLKKKTGKKKG